MDDSEDRLRNGRRLFCIEESRFVGRQVIPNVNTGGEPDRENAALEVRSCVSARVEELAVRRVVPAIQRQFQVRVIDLMGERVEKRLAGLASEMGRVAKVVID